MRGFEVQEQAFAADVGAGLEMMHQGADHQSRSEACRYLGSELVVAIWC